MLRTPQLILIAGISLLILIEGFCGYKVHTLSGRQEKIKEDYSMVNKVSFGLLSVSEWRDKIDFAITRRIENFHFTKSQEADLEKEIEQILHALINKADSLIDKPKKSLGGKIKKLAFNVLVNQDKLHEQVPAFSQKILRQIEKRSSKQRLSDLAESKLKQLGKATYDSAEYQKKSMIDSLLDKYHVSTTSSFEKKTESSLSSIRRTTYTYAFGMLGCIVILLILWRLLRNRQELYSPLFILSILSALILLLTGLTTTMIEVDARIKSIHFVLMGETISFKNQVLFFQSKSIIDIVKILIRTGKYDSVIVGILILCFSILFPIGKLLSAGIYLLGKKKWTKNKFIKYFAFKSSKWSMADVMVVAILMTYIGFNGILESQLSDLNVHNETLTSITTDNTSLQPGYIVFVGFVIYGFILSQILKKITKYREE